MNPQYSDEHLKIIIFYYIDSEEITGSDINLEKAHMILINYISNY